VVYSSESESTHILGFGACNMKKICSKRTNCIFILMYFDENFFNGFSGLKERTVSYIMFQQFLLASFNYTAKFFLIICSQKDM
jgi:hypothetical protein